MCARLGDLAQASDHQRATLELLRGLDRPALLAVTLGNLATVLDRLGQLAEAADAARESLAAQEQAGAVAGQALQHNNLSVILRQQGETAEAVRHAEQALELYKTLGSIFGTGMALCNVAEANRLHGNPAEAVELAQQALAIPELADHSEHQMQTKIVLGNVYRDIGVTEAALEQFEDALPVAQRVGDEEAEAFALTGLAYVCAQPVAAVEIAQQAVQIADRIQFAVLRAKTRTALAEAHLRAGQHDQAREVAAEALRLHLQTGHRAGELATNKLLERLDRAHDRGE